MIGGNGGMAGKMLQLFCSTSVKMLGFLWIFGPVPSFAVSHSISIYTLQLFLESCGKYVPFDANQLGHRNHQATSNDW